MDGHGIEIIQEVNVIAEGEPTATLMRQLAVNHSSLQNALFLTRLDA
jgi:hypothetical protein